MAVEFTPEQQSAIDSRGGALIVAAAAGSGKTAVLVERVIRRVTDVENPADIDSLLIVTFTNAAAGEMRERVAANWPCWAPLGFRLSTPSAWILCARISACAGFLPASVCWIKRKASC